MHLLGTTFICRLKHIIGMVHMGLFQNEYSAHVHHTEGTCHAVRPWSSFMCFQLFLDNNGGLWHRGIRSLWGVSWRLLTFQHSTQYKPHI